MPKRTEQSEPTALVFRRPLEGFADELRADADRWRMRPGNDDVADAYENAAARLEERIATADSGEWLLTEDAAPLLRITPDAVRARCRSAWVDRGLAEKRGGIWFVHRKALASR